MVLTNKLALIALQVTCRPRAMSRHGPRLIPTLASTLINNLLLILGEFTCGVGHVLIKLACEYFLKIRRVPPHWRGS